MNKKKLLAISLVISMIAILSFSTLAWFTDDDSATNDFTVNGGGQSAEEIFSVDVKENVDGESQPVDNKAFEDVLPGANYKKEAYVTNTGSNDQYIRVTLTVSDWALIKDIVAINMDDAFAANWHIDSTDVSVDAEGNLIADSDASVNADGNLVVVMYLDKILAANETVDIMDYVSISTAADQNDFAAEGFADGFYIDIKADAVQAENILATYGDVEWQNARESFNSL